MFSTSRAKPKKFCACLLTQPSPPGIGQKGDLPDVGSRESGGMLTSGRATRPPCSSMEKMLTAPDILFYVFLICSSRRVLFSRSSRHHRFPSSDAMCIKSARASYSPCFWGKEKENDIRAASVHHPPLLPPLPRTPSSNTISSTIRPCDELY